VGAGGSERHGCSSDESDKERPQRECKAPRNIETEIIPMVDLGKEVRDLFPKTAGDLSKQVKKSLQAANSSKAKVDGQPLNFGVVLPGTIYRSSFPQIEDFQYLGTLGLKTIVSLVDKEFSPEFRAFMRTNRIKHVIIRMQGTKKVEITETIMRSIMKVVLDKENHPLLIHCNHGKHRTGCAVAVVRHIAGWNVDQILEEYRGYAESKVRDCDITYITDYKVSNLQGLFIRKKQTASSTTGSLKMARMLVGTGAMFLVWILTVLFWRADPS